MPKTLKEEIEEKIEGMGIVTSKMDMSELFYCIPYKDLPKLYSLFQEELSKEREKYRKEKEKIVLLCKEQLMDKEEWELVDKLKVSFDYNSGLQTIINFLENELGYEVKLSQQEGKGKG